MIFFVNVNAFLTIMINSNSNKVWNTDFNYDNINNILLYYFIRVVVKTHVIRHLPRVSSSFPSLKHR